MRPNTVVARLLVLLGCASCTGVLDLDRYREAPPQTPRGGSTFAGSSDEFNGLRVALVAMKPHLGQMLEYRVVDARNFVQSRGVVSSLVGEDMLIEVPLAIPKSNGPYRLDFYADVDKSGNYNGIGSVLANDHAWRIEPLVDQEGITPVPGLVQVRFVHNTAFTDIEQYPAGTPNNTQDTGLAARVKVAGLAGLEGKMAQVRVADHGSHHVVATYRVPALAGAAFDAVVTGVVEQSTDYDVDLYVDANGDGVYGDPSQGGGDLGLRVLATSTGDGLDATVDATDRAAAKIAVGPP